MRVFLSSRVRSLFSMRCFCLSVGVFFLLTPVLASAAGNIANIHSFAQIVCLLFVAHLFSVGAERLKLPSVSAEMFVGILIGNLSFWKQNFLPAWLFSINKDSFILFLSDVGLMLLLFEIGLHFDVKALKKRALNAFLVAFLGASLAVLSGVFLIGPFLLPQISLNAWLFIGATLSATSIAVASRLFDDFGLAQTEEAQVTLGAAIFDDIFGFALLAALSELVHEGHVSISLIVLSLLKAFIFLACSFLLGRSILSSIVDFLSSRVDNSPTMLLIILVSVACLGAVVAHELALAPIVGVFAAGLALGEDKFSLFRDNNLTQLLRLSCSGEQLKDSFQEKLALVQKKQYMSLLFPLKRLFLPLFFIVVGTELDLSAFGTWHNTFLFFAIFLVAIFCKLVSSVFLPSRSRWIVGWGMVPRGEVGLVFLALGRSYGILVDPYFSILVAVVVATTIVSPLVLGHLLKSQSCNRSY